MGAWLDNRIFQHSSSPLSSAAVSVSMQSAWRDVMRLAGCALVRLRGSGGGRADLRGHGSELPRRAAYVLYEQVAGGQAGR